MGWIDDVLTATKESECPKRYIYWACLAAMSAVVKRNVYILKNGVYRLHPNIYVMGVSDSGSRKSFANHVLESLLMDFKWVRTISGMKSIQAIIDRLDK